MSSRTASTSNGKWRGKEADSVDGRTRKSRNNRKAKPGVVSSLNKTLPVKPTPLANSGSELLRQLQSTTRYPPIEEEAPPYTAALAPPTPTTLSGTAVEKVLVHVEPAHPSQVANNLLAGAASAGNLHLAPNQSFYGSKNYQNHGNVQYGHRINYHRGRNFCQDSRPAQGQNFIQNRTSFDADTSLPMPVPGAFDAWRELYLSGRTTQMDAQPQLGDNIETMETWRREFNCDIDLFVKRLQKRYGVPEAGHQRRE